MNKGKIRNITGRDKWGLGWRKLAELIEFSNAKIKKFNQFLKFHEFFARILEKY